MTTGPGVTMPMATASMNCRSVSQWYSSTTYTLRNGAITRPLPNTNSPILKKNANSFSDGPMNPAAVRPRNPALSDLDLGATGVWSVVTGPANTRQPKRPAIMKTLTSSCLNVTVIAAATAANSHASRRVFRALRPNCEQALRMSAVITGATP